MDERQHLSVMHSVISPNAIQQFVEQNYDCGNVTGCSLLRAYVNDVYALQTSSRSGRNRLVFKVYRRDWRNEADVEWDVAVQEHLSQAGLPTSEPMSLRDGSAVARLIAPEGVRAGVLFAELAGAKPTPPFTDELYFHHGVSLAKLHTGLDSYPISPNARTYDEEFLTHRSLAIVEETLGASSTGVSRLRDVAKQLHERLIDLDEPADWGICHGDPTMDNIHVLLDGRHAFFDFDLAGYCWRALDLSGIFHWAGWDPAARSFWTAFLEGYRSTRTFSESDVALLPVMAAAWEMWTIAHELDCWRRWSGTWRMTQAQVEARIDHIVQWDA